MTVFIANAILDKCCIRQIVLIMFCVWFSENWDSIGYFFHTERFCLFSSILTDENSFIYLILWCILRITGDLFSKYPLLFGRPKSQLLVIECSVRPSFSGDGLSVATVHSLAAWLTVQSASRVALSPLTVRRQGDAALKIAESPCHRLSRERGMQITCALCV